jgi:hypothetical protein
MIKMMKNLNWIFIFSVLLIFLGCESKVETMPKKNLPQQQNITPPPQQRIIEKQKNIDSTVAKEIIAVIKENLEATEIEDKERVLATIHRDSPQYDSTIRGLDFVLANYDLEFNLEKVEVIEVSESDAKVYYIQTTRAIKGQGFTNKKDEGIHHLKKYKGEWKIFQTEYINTIPIR